MAKEPPPANPTRVRNLRLGLNKRKRMNDDRPPLAIRIDLQGCARLGEVPVSIAEGNDIAATRRDGRARNPPDSAIAGMESAPLRKRPRRAWRHEADQPARDAPAAARGHTDDDFLADVAPFGERNRAVLDARLERD